MYELEQVSEKCYYIQCPAKIGIYRTGEKDVYLIDSGNDKDAGKKVLRILREKGWNLQALLNTHFHADHIGGNAYLQSQTGCKVYAPKLERAFVCNPLLEPMFLYGGNPPKDLRHKFLLAKESDALPLTEEILPDGLSLLPLPGHSLDMVGFHSEEGVNYLADCLASEETLEKYQVSVLMDVEAYLATLEKVRGMQGEIYIPSHAPATKEISPLAQKNIDKVHEILDLLKELLSSPRSFEEILQGVFLHYGLEMDFSQNVLVGSTLRSYLSYLRQKGQAGVFFQDARLLWGRDVLA